MIIRHAKSSWADATLRDLDRPLNERGKRDAPFMARHLFNQGLRPDQIVSSPARRALDTAYYFMREFNLEHSFLTVIDSIYEASIRRLDNVVKQLDDTWSTVFLFGHNPTLTDWVNKYAHIHLDNLPTTGVAWFKFKGSVWAEWNHEEVTLAHLWYPKMLQPLS